ncbi:ATP-binding cassette domain-containing protein [Acidipila sp. EB88]|uniref:ATP-binding cassette domain-containing protein n=1 Tax=Acidipila sp. EB88 TaxID=2305226 RepID=UPI001F3C40DC|nr:ATP-binding cassette domain-containing protein [Acidipila sp. EB88]
MIEAAHLSKSYPRTGPGENGEALVVDDVSFTLRRGETLGLVGESGSGKSTIARMVLGLVPPSGGSVTFDGVALAGAGSSEMRRLRRRMQPVFQDPYAALNPRMRVHEILAEPFVIHKDDIARSKPALRTATSDLLGRVGLDASALDRYPHEFSGGQRQRINIARALALRPEVLVLDEPVSALDVSVGAQVVNLLQQLQREFALTYLFITHSMPLVRYLATQIAVLRGGKLLELGTAAQVTGAPAHAYTRALMAATPALRA